ncbi:MAG: carbohydrate ABC transporter permease [Treponema sp.]|jgi:multiple sugar transport system permease protein|nr:carbohydrate ABC transporter permease [Treponema sp.]
MSAQATNNNWGKDLQYRRTARLFSEKIVPRLVLIGMCFIFILPYYWMITTSLKSNMELRTIPPTLFPKELHFEHYAEAIQFIPFFQYMMNSLTIVIFGVIGAIISNSFIAYGFSRINWPGREPLFIVVIATMFIPFPVVLVALFDIFARFRLVNTFYPLILPAYVGSAFYIFMMRQYLMTIPKEISDAGFIDGATEFQIFYKLVLPLMKPVIAVVAIFTALGSWNDFLGPLIYLQNQKLYTLSIGLQFFRSQHEVEYTLLMAASTLVALPVVIIFLCFQRFFVEGITIGAVKG